MVSTLKTGKVNKDSVIKLSILLLLILFGAKLPIVSYLGLLYSACLVVLSNDCMALCTMVISVPFAEIFKNSPGNTSFFTYLTLLFCAKALLRKKTISIPAVLVITYSFLISVFNLQLLGIVKFICNILIILFGIDEYNLENYHYPVFMSFITGFLTASFASYFGLHFFGLRAFITNKTEGLYITHFSGLSTDPNYYAVGMIIAMCLLVILYSRKELNLFQLTFLGILFSFFIIITYSKSATIMLALPIILLLYVNKKQKKYAVQAICILVVVTLTGYAFSHAIDLLEPIIRRFTQISDIDTFTTGRTFIWKDYMSYFNTHPLFLLIGKGIGAELVNNRAAHNTFIELLYHFGVFGSALILLLLFNLFSKHKAKRNFLNYSIIICMALMYSFLSEVFAYEMPFHLLIAYIVYNFENGSKDLFSESFL